MKNVLIVAGGWDGHEPEQCAEIFAGELEKRGYKAEISYTLDAYLDTEKMSQLSLIVPIWTMSETGITDEQFKGLSNAVKNGVGLGGFHGGMCDSFRGNIDYQWMTGGQFLSHPGNIKPYRVNISDNTHEITSGLSDFEMNSEQYYMLTDPGNNVLAKTTFVSGLEDAPWVENTVMPVVWTKSWGQGRVFFSSLGHVATDFDVPEAREITIRGMLWASK
jgi:type 1 glutamine amidotransferase